MLDLVTFLTAWIENLISFSLTHLKSFPTVLWDFIAFKGCEVIFLTMRSEVCRSIYKWLVWEKEERLLRLVPSAMLDKVEISFQMSWGFLVYCCMSCCCPVLHLLHLTTFLVPFWELVKNVLLSADAHLSSCFFILANKEAVCWFEASL